MIDFLIPLYPWIKSLHIIAVICWMAGLFYLPRLFVYHAEEGKEEKLDQLFQKMEVRLLRVIMNPAMIATWVFGILLLITPGIVDWAAVWPYTKLAAVSAMTWFHHWLGAQRKGFINGTNKTTGRQFRMMNEVPTLLLIIIVLSVVVKF